MQQTSSDRSQGLDWTPVMAASASTLVGIGLARFAYTPLLPALIAAHWFSASAAAYLGAANLAGYLAGALSGRLMARKCAVIIVLRSMMVLATITFAASSTPVSFAWFFFWRLASGVSGGVLMVLAAPLVLASMPPARRGLASGFIFMSVGLGIVISGSVIPLLLHHGLATTWLGLTIMSLLLTLIAWPLWPNELRPGVAATANTSAASADRPSRRVTVGLYVTYGLNAVGLVPHMLFLVDFVERTLKLDLWMGAVAWITFGIGAMVGPVLLGHVGDRIGFRRAVRCGLLVQAIAIGVIALVATPMVIFPSAFLVGAFVPGIVPLMLGRLHEVIDDHSLRQRAWSFATVAFAVGQASGAYLMSFLIVKTGDPQLIFGVGASMLLLALLADFSFTGPKGVVHTSASASCAVR